MVEETRDEVNPEAVQRQAVKNARFILEMTDGLRQFAEMIENGYDYGKQVKQLLADIAEAQAQFKQLQANNETLEAVGRSKIETAEKNAARLLAEAKQQGDEILATARKSEREIQARLEENARLAAKSVEKMRAKLDQDKAAFEDTKRREEESLVQRKAELDKWAESLTARAKQIAEIAKAA